MLQKSIILIFISLITLNANALTREKWVADSKGMAISYVEGAMVNFLKEGPADHFIYKNFKLIRQQFDKVEFVWAKPGEQEFPRCGNKRGITGGPPNLYVPLGQSSKIVICEKTFSDKNFTDQMLAQFMIHEIVHTIQDVSEIKGPSHLVDLECQALRIEKEVMHWSYVGSHINEQSDALEQICKMERNFSALAPSYNNQCHSG